MINFKKNKVVLIGIVAAILVVVSIAVFFLTRNNENSNVETEGTLYTMYVKINPLVKLTFREINYKCDEPIGTCTKIDGIVDYELLNDDAKDIYDDVDFKDKGVYEVIGILCKIARDNGIAFETIKITTDYNFDYNNFVEEMTNNSKYEFDYTITLDIKERLNEQEIINEDLESNPNIISYNVTFDSDGGSEVTKQVVKENDMASKPAAPTKKGYKFVEWQLNGIKYDFNSEVKEDITLKAKWEKESTGTINTNPNTDNSSTDVTQTETNSSNTATNTKVMSTPDNINLNDNILVINPEGSGSIDASKYIITDNAKTVLADFVSGTNTYCPPCFGVEDCSFELETAWEEKLNQLTYNSEIAIKTKNEIVSYLSNQTGIINIKINEDPTSFKISYDHLSLWYENVGLDEFVRAYDNKYSNIRNEVMNIFYKNGGVIIEGGGAGGGGEPVLLDEALCAKYNLTCSRW